MNETDTCTDYGCEWTMGEGEHRHVGVQPYLRRVIGPGRTLIDGLTGLPPASPAPPVEPVIDAE